jgi:hypothetical protein
MKPEIQPILIIGTQRSGSNLLRLMLNQLPEIDAPHPPHLLQVFFPLLPLYGDLNEAGNYSALIADVCRYIEVNPVRWTNAELNADTIFNRCRHRTLIELYKVVYELKAEKSNAKYWCCKSLANIHFIQEIESAGLKPFYIYLLRDGRNVAASFERAIVGEKHMYFIAQQWKREQEMAMKMLAENSDKRIATVRYEEFIASPKNALSPALEMLGLKWNDSILEYYLSQEAKQTAAAGEMWKNVIKPVNSDGMNHYTQTLTPEKVLIFEKVAGNTLTALGYKLENSGELLKEDFTADEIAAFKIENDTMKLQIIQKKIKDAELRAPQEKILNEIRGKKNTGNS